MSTNIEKCILVEIIKMCDFHLKDNCFHPERVQRGFVARSCEVHDCKHCTNPHWQQTKIAEKVAFHNNLIKISKQELPSFNMQRENAEETKQFSISKIFG